MNLKKKAKQAKRSHYRALFVVFIVLGIISSQVLLSVAIASGAYEISGYKAELKELNRTVDKAKQNLNSISSPQNLALKAEKLGMVSSSIPAYLRLSDGAVLGSPVPASANDVLSNGGDKVLIHNSTLSESMMSAPEKIDSAERKTVDVVEVAEESDDGFIVLTNGLPPIQTR